MSRRREMCAMGGGSPYAFIEAVHFNGASSCYIDTGFKANTTTTRFVGAFSFDDLGTYRGLIGSRGVQVADASSCCIWAFNNNTLRLDWNTYNQRSQTLSTNVKYELDATRGSIKVGGTTFTGGYAQSVDQSYNFLIGNFSNASASPYSAGLLGNCYECWLYSNNAIVRHYLPCIRTTDNAVGFWEELSDTFVTNAGFAIPS